MGIGLVWCIKARQRSSFLHKHTGFDISFSHRMRPNEGRSALPGQPVSSSCTKDKAICYTVLVPWLHNNYQPTQKHHKAPRHAQLLRMVLNQNQTYSSNQEQLLAGAGVGLCQWGAGCCPQELLLRIRCKSQQLFSMPRHFSGSDLVLIPITEG